MESKTVKNIYDGCLWYQVNLYDNKYYFNYATNRGIRKGQYSRTNGIKLKEKHIYKAKEIYKNIESEYDDIKSIIKSKKSNILMFTDTTDFYNYNFNKRFRKYLEGENNEL